MIPFSGGSFLLLVSCIIVPSLTYPNIQRYPNSDRNDVKGFPETAREKRAARIIGASVLQGLRAIKQLLSGAKQVPSDTPPTRQFVKEGGYQQAYKDFATIIRNPKDITVFPTEAKTYGRTGNIGDIQFILRYNGEGKQSTIEIRKMGAFVPTGTNLKYLKQWTSSGRLLDKITYSDVVYKSKGRSL